MVAVLDIVRKDLNLMLNEIEPIQDDDLLNISNNSLVNRRFYQRNEFHYTDIAKSKNIDCFLLK